LDNPHGLYHLLMGATILLLILGVVMVLSASSILSFRETGSPYSIAQRQALFAGIGLVLMAVAMRLPVATWRKIAVPVLIVAVVLLVIVLIPGIGVVVNGQRNWIDIAGPFRVQPSEFAKYALLLWSADLLARREGRLDTWKRLLMPLLPLPLHHSIFFLRFSRMPLLCQNSLWRLKRMSLLRTLMFVPLPYQIPLPLLLHQMPLMPQRQFVTSPRRIPP
jgi:cell division protein FtsW (lipid II flippase)